jgi:hypothetical protein
LSEFKIYNMKNILFYGIIFLCLVSCNGDGKLIKRGKGTFMTVEALNGDNTKTKVEFLVGSDIKLGEAKINAICKDAVAYADWNAKFKPTYKHSKSAILTCDEKTGEITACMNGTAENAYGVPDDVSTYIFFTKKGKLKEDADGLPEIL